MKSLPRVRTGLLRHTLDEQVLVYDTRNDQVHLLDPTTACVMELLEEGGWTEPKMVPEVARRLHVEPSAELVALAIDQLRRSTLLEEGTAPPKQLLEVNRRDMVRKLAYTGAAAMLVPAIATLTATRGYAQASFAGAGGSACIYDGNCASGNCCPSGTCSADACFPDGTACNPAAGALCECCSNLCGATSPGLAPNICGSTNAPV